MMKDNTRRFSNRVEDYVKYRPHYPAAIIPYLEHEFNLHRDKIIADVGAGTGISAALFLDAGYTVLAVEPNKEMRAQSVVLLGSYPGFKDIDGTAEQTSLEAGSISAIVAGQAFHWFDADKAKAEFRRILKADGLIVLMWNEREVRSPFEAAYDALINRHGIDYVAVQHRNMDEKHIAAFFSPAVYRLQTFPNRQVFGLNGLKGRLLSSSYMPAVNDPGYGPMIRDLELLFAEYQENGVIAIHYTTKVYAGRVT